LSNFLGGALKDAVWLFIGDSLIAMGDWQEMFPGVFVDCRGVAGETVAGLLARLESIIADIDPPDLVFIMTGINDVAMEDFAFMDSYGKVIELLAVRYPQARIVVNSLLPVQLPWLSAEVVPKVNTMLRRLAERMAVVFLDIYRNFTDDEGRPVGQYYLGDGVHLSAQGYRVWAEALSGFRDDDERNL